ncbi:hypothetical protein PG993_008433 [Apiospora rasikravindrae]|uniref:Uncharacterized protein n=1 Tax=Apiospora rasikravindrae TaxID=990691 RepID=A0ABR1T0B7_9PEZI
MLLIQTTLLSTALVIGTARGRAFEGADFNVTEALIQQGVDLSAVPELVPSTERSSNLACPKDHR